MKSIAKLVCMMFLTMFIVSGGPAHAFPFAYPEIELVESEHGDAFKTDVSSVFDAHGNIHAVWADARTPGELPKLYGNTVLRDRNPFGSYLVFGDDVDFEYVSPVVLSNKDYPDRLYTLGIRVTSDPNMIVLARHDLNLPVSVNTVELSTFTVPVPPGMFFTDLNAVWTDHILNFAFISNNRVYYGTYDISANNWSYSGAVAMPPDVTVSNLSMTSDGAGYIYLAYNEHDDITFWNKLFTRRSNQPKTFSAGLLPERIVAESYDSYRSVIAATGNRDTNLNLRVSIVHTPEMATFPELICVTEENGLWELSDPFGHYSTDIDFGFFPYHAMDIDYDQAGRLYAVWEQDDHLYGSISSNAGQTFGAIMPLGPYDLEGRISLGMGHIPGNVTVVYQKYHIFPYAVPFALVSMSDIFDSCDKLPAETDFWDGYSGVSLDTSRYHGQTSSGPGIDPSSYRLTTESLKSGDGLLRDFGIEEHQGVLELYFYDSMTTEADFSIVFENSNAKNVVRMLGVRNEEHTNDYLYFDGTDWVQLAGRHVGWHHVIVTIDDDGTYIQIEEEPETGVYQTYLDMAFTSFTSILIEGGSDSDPYNVDDIRVETIPIDGFPPVVPLPVDSWVTILILMSVIGLILARFR
jgi:hypothetical protein